MMHDDVIDDEVRRSFPGLSDDEIYAFYVANKTAQTIRTKLLRSDLFYGKMIRRLGWDAFQEFLIETTGDCELDADDYIALTNAVGFLDELESVSLYAAIYGASAEASKKTVASRNKSFKKLSAVLNGYDIEEGF